MKLEDKVKKLKKMELEGELLLQQEARTQSTYAEAVQQNVRPRFKWRPVKPKKPDEE